MSMKIKWPYEFPGAYWVDKDEEDAVCDVLRNGSLFRYYGLRQPKYVDAYEAAACKFYNVKFALAVNSGTGALIAAMHALGIGPGCEVIVPSFMWIATVGAVVQCNAIPVLCEVDDSLSMDPKNLEKKITSRTKLIVPVHMAGAPCDMDAIMSIANKHKIPVLEDCAQCNGGSFGGQKVGTFGTMGIFSLQLNKNMTCGEGGLIITNDERLYTRSFSAHDLGLVRVNGRLAAPESYAIQWGGGRRMGELCGAVASVQIKKLPKILEHMRASKRRIKAMIQDIHGLMFRRLNDAEGDTGPFLIIVLDDEAKTLATVEKMKQQGLHNVSRIADYGLHIYSNIPALVDKVPLSAAGEPWSLESNAESVYDYAKGVCPRSDDLFSRSILVPVPSLLSFQEEKFMATVIRESVVGKRPYQ